MDNELELEFALPLNIDDEAIECSIQLAEEMNILYEKGGRVSLVYVHSMGRSKGKAGIQLKRIPGKLCT